MAAVTSTCSPDEDFLARKRGREERVGWGDFLILVYFIPTLLQIWHDLGGSYVEFKTSLLRISFFHPQRAANMSMMIPYRRRRSPNSQKAVLEINIILFPISVK